MNKEKRRAGEGPRRLARRAFLARSGAWLTGAAGMSALEGFGFSGAVSRAGTLREPSAKTTFAGGEDSLQSTRIFDCHLHCPAEEGEKWQWRKVTHTFEDFVRYLDRTGVQRGIINCQRSYGKTPAEFVAGNREVARFVEKSKGRFLGACVVNPQFIEEALRELEDCRKQLGFVWVGELCNYMIPYQYAIPEFAQLVEQVTRLKMVLALHTEGEEMDFIAKKFPQATIAFAHFGDDHEFDDIFKRIDTVAQNPNFYLDTSGYGHDRVGVLEYAVKKIGPDRVLFGSDFTINDPGTVLARIRNAFLSEEEKGKILSGNLRALLKKVQAPG